MPVGSVFFLTLVNLVNYFDRYIVQAVEPRITAEFRLSNTQAGYLVSAFVLGYFIFSPIFGFLGDRFDKRKVMAFGLIAWSLCTAMTSFAVGSVSFFLCRVLVGIGEACYGAIVPVYLKGRVSSTVSLNKALAIFYVAIPVGAALGFVGGGIIAAEYGWRPMFLGAAVPGLLLAFGFLFLPIDTSVQPLADSKTGNEFRIGVRKIVLNPFIMLIIGGYVCNTFALNGIAAFVVRHGASLGISEADAAAYFGMVLVATGLVGTTGGGYLASARSRDSADSIKSLLSFVVLTTFLGVPLLACCFLARSSGAFFGLCAAAELLIFASVAPLNAVLVERAPAGFESLTQGLTIFFIQLLGGFLGPVVVGMLADGIGELGTALQVTTAALFMSGILWLLACRRCSRSHTVPLG